MSRAEVMDAFRLLLRGKRIEETDIWREELADALEDLAEACSKTARSASNLARRYRAANGQAGGQGRVSVGAGAAVLPCGWCGRCTAAPGGSDPCGDADNGGYDTMTVKEARKALANAYASGEFYPDTFEAIRTADKELAYREPVDPGRYTANAEEVWVCPTCGDNIAARTLWKYCPRCGQALHAI